jgi:hypothetical protein
LRGARSFDSGAPDRSLAALVLASDFNGFGMGFHVLRVLSAPRIAPPDYATDKLKK